MIKDFFKFQNIVSKMPRDKYDILILILCTYANTKVEHKTVETIFVNGCTKEDMTAIFSIFELVFKIITKDSVNKIFPMKTTKSLDVKYKIIVSIALLAFFTNLVMQGYPNVCNCCISLLAVCTLISTILAIKEETRK